MRWQKHRVGRVSAVGLASMQWQRCTVDEGQRERYAELEL